MVGNDPTNAPTFEAQLDARHASQDQILSAMHQLEAALGSAAQHREAEWHEQVCDTLGALETVLGAEAAESLRPDSLLSDLERNHPRLRARVHGVQAQYANIRNTLDTLRLELSATAEPTPDFADVRERLSWLLSALRHQRARENDLLYDAYRDAFGVDIDRDLIVPRRNITQLEGAPTATEPEDVTTRTSNRAESLDALQHVESRAENASQGREGDWLNELRASAQALEQALSREQAGTTDLFADLERAEPRLRNRIAQLRDRCRELTTAVRNTRDRLDSTEIAEIDVPDLRRALDKLATEIRYLRAREADLVYEAYNVDLGAGD
jgi:chromosome segregation ATPase